MDEKIFSRRFCFEHESGDVLYPYRIRSRQTGALRFVVSKIATKGKHARDIDDEDEMVRLILNEDYKVRMKDPNTAREGGYRRTSPSIIGVRRLA